MYTLPKLRPDPDFILSQWRKIAIAGLTYVLAVVLLFGARHTGLIREYGSANGANWGIVVDNGPGFEFQPYPGPFVCYQIWPKPLRPMLWPIFREGNPLHWLAVDC